MTEYERFVKDGFNYQEYINSEHWKDFRKKHLEDFCSVCTYKPLRIRALRFRSDLILHHLTYARVGNEFPEDVITVCKSCHWYIHAIERAEIVPLHFSHHLAALAHRFPKIKTALDYFMNGGERNKVTLDLLWDEVEQRWRS